MKIFKSDNNKIDFGTVLTIGTFDGVHIGHNKIIKHLVDTAKKSGLKSGILTFFPHPRVVLQKESNIKLINTLNERIKILESLGLDFLFIETFTKEFSRLSSEEFVNQLLVKKLNAKKIIIGYDHRFGRNRNANIDDLIKFGEINNFEVEEISAQDINDVAVSSTKIRKALIEGDIIKANLYLGYNFILNGIVVKGKGIGRQMNFPTANIQIEEDYKLIPKQGVYIVKSFINNKDVFGMMNIGVNPTVNGDKETIEVHFFNFDKNIYNQTVQVEFLKRIRDENKFESVNALKNQLKKDEQVAHLYLETYCAR